MNSIAVHCVAILFLLVGNVFGQGAPFYYAPELFDANLSGAVCGFSPDGKTIYFAREDSVAKKIFLYAAQWKKDKWSDEAMLPFSGQANDMNGRISADGQKFYFTSDRPGGSSANDQWNIWVAEKTPNGWSTPYPLKAINDKGLECCAVPLGNSLIFSGDRGKSSAWWISSLDLKTREESFLDTLNSAGTWQWPSSFPEPNVMLLNSMRRADTHGMDDIYISFFRNGRWTLPANLGTDVNTSAYEDGAIVSPDKKWLIYCQHERPDSPSRVVAVNWKRIKSRFKV